MLDAMVEEEGDGGAARSKVNATLDGHLLLVEDDADIGATVCEFVRGEGYSVIWAADGEAALAHLRRGHRPALIVTDFMMPRLSGADLLQELGRDGELRDIPIVVVSAVPQLAAAAGIPPNVLVTKPLDLEDLMVIVSRTCRRRRERASWMTPAPAFRSSVAE